MNMDVRPLRNEADYDWALAEIEAYFRDPPQQDTQEAARFDVLAALIESYETKFWPIEAPDPVEQSGRQVDAEEAHAISSRISLPESSHHVRRASESDRTTTSNL